MSLPPVGQISENSSRVRGDESLPVSSGPNVPSRSGDVFEPFGSHGAFTAKPMEDGEEPIASKCLEGMLSLGQLSVRAIGIALGVILALPVYAGMGTLDFLGRVVQLAIYRIRGQESSLTERARGSLFGISAWQAGDFIVNKLVAFFTAPFYGDHRFAIERKIDNALNPSSKGDPLVGDHVTLALNKNRNRMIAFATVLSCVVGFIPGLLNAWGAGLIVGFYHTVLGLGFRVVNCMRAPENRHPEHRRVSAADVVGRVFWMLSGSILDVLMVVIDAVCPHKHALIPGINRQAANAS